MKVKPLLIAMVLLIMTLLSKAENIEAPTLHSNAVSNGVSNDGLRFSSMRKQPSLKYESHEAAPAISAKGRVGKQNYTFQEEGLRSNLVFTPTCAYVSQINDDGPTVKRLDFATMKLETFTQDKPEYWQPLDRTVLADLHNGDIAYGTSYYLFIMGNKTFDIKQAFLLLDSNYPVTMALTYFNQTTGQSRYLFGRNSYPTFMKEYIKQVNGTYIEKDLFRTQVYDSANMMLTGMSTAVSMVSQLCQVFYWSNINSVVVSSTDEKYYQKNRLKVAISHDETFFVVRNSSGHYEFYHVDQKYDTKLTSALLINKDALKKGRLTMDDKTLFVSLSTSNNQYRIAKVNVETKYITFVTDEQGKSDNQIDFQLFDDKYNRFVGLSVRNKSHFLQLRTLNDSTLIHELPIAFNFTVLEWQLVGAIEWGLTFAVATRNLPYDDDLEFDSKLFLYKVESDKIVALNYSIPQISFTGLEACQTYVISSKYSFSNIYVHHYSNLTLAKNIEVQVVYPNAVIVEKDVFIIADNQAFTIFDLKKSFEPKGFFYRMITMIKGPTLPLAFPKKGFIYEPRTMRWKGGDTTLLIYNISSPAITSWKNLTSDDNQCFSLSYSINSQNPSCNYFFYIELDLDDDEYTTRNPRLVRLSECQEAKVVIPINAFNDDSVIAKVTFSTDKKYLFVVVCQREDVNCMIEARAVSALSKTIYHESLVFGLSSRNGGSPSINVDLVDGNMLLIQGESLIYAKFLQQAGETSHHSEEPEVNAVEQ